MNEPSFLLPGAQTWRPAQSCTHPHPGWILTCHLDDIQDFPGVAPYVDTLPPWIPLAIAVPPSFVPTIEATVRFFDTTRHSRTAIISYTGASPIPHKMVLQEINARPSPTIPVLAEWLVARLNLPELIPLLRSGMAPPGASTSHPLGRRTLQRRVLSALSCHPSDLRRLVRLARQERCAASVARLALLAETTEARLRQLVSTLLGETLSFYNLHPGWEWVLEAACRQGLGAGGWGLTEDSTALAVSGSRDRHGGGAASR